MVYLYKRFTELYLIINLTFQCTLHALWFVVKHESPNWVGVLHSPLSLGQKQIQFLKHIFKFLEYQTMHKVQKLYDSDKYYNLSGYYFRIYKLWLWLNWTAPLFINKLLSQPRCPLLFRLFTSLSTIFRLCDLMWAANLDGTMKPNSILTDIWIQMS